MADELKIAPDEIGPGGETKLPAGVASPDDIAAVPVRHPGRWVAAAVVIYLVVTGVNSAVTNPRFEWDVVGKYLFDSAIIKGLGTTIFLTVVTMIVGIILGIVLAVMRRSENKLLSSAAWVYIWFFRGTPVLVQILFWSFVGAIYPIITFGIPFGGPDLVHLRANSLITPFMAAILGLALNEAAYMSEVVRGGLLSVDEGQGEAAEALGMSKTQALRRIILPQAMRVIIPPTGNETISMLKTTSLVSVIAYSELLYSAQLIYSQNYKTIPLLLVASFWYLLMTSILQTGQFYIERYYGRGSSKTVQADTLFQSITKNMFRTQRNPGGTI